MALSSKYLSYSDRTAEVAFAVVMVIIINGYVALSDLNTGWTYIVVVNLGACLGWGMIDGFIYAISSSIDRNRIKNILLKLKSSAKDESVLETVEKGLESTFLSSFDNKGKEAVAKEILVHVADASLGDEKLFTRDDVMGWLYILGIYLSVGFLLSLPFLILEDKLFAWLVSNTCGTGWLFLYGVQLGKLAGKNRWLIGLFMVMISVLLYVVSYTTGVL